MRTIAFGGVLFLASTVAGLASPVGTLTTDSCGGGVTVTAGLVDFLPPGGTNGCIITGTTTGITYSGGFMGSGVTGTVGDIPGGSATDFIAFAAHPTLHFNLLGLGPGSGTDVCTGLGIGQSCSVVIGSPFVLTLQAGGTTQVFLRLFGVAFDASGSSLWDGGFTVNLSGQTPAAIQATILGGGSVTSTHAGNFTLTAIPEPGSIALMGVGMALFAAIRRRS
jgi:PEP-CTERM motif